MTALSLIGAGAMAVEETERERIERELDILRRRRALYLKWNVPGTLCVVIAFGAIVVVLLALLVAETFKDPLMGLFIAAMVAAVGGLSWLLARVTAGTGPVWPLDRLRLVSIVQSRRRTGALVPLFKVYVHPFSITDEFDEMIAWREQRLAELKGTQP